MHARAAQNAAAAANSFTECELNFLAAAEAAQPFALVYLCILPTQTANNESRVLFAEAARRRVALVQSAITQPPHNYNCTSSSRSRKAPRRASSLFICGRKVFLSRPPAASKLKHNEQHAGYLLARRR
jgi:hypothetical protein